MTNESNDKTVFIHLEEDNENARPNVQKFPKAVFFIIGNEFCERFSFYGMKAILPLYLTGSLHFNENRSTTIIHAFNFSAYFFTLFGGILSDSLWGRYRTILYLSLIYCVGMAALAVSSFPSWNGMAWPFIAGLCLVAFGTGGIKPCVSAFGGDQFDANQVAALALYFSIFYFSINAGSVLSMFITPILRQNVHCFGQNDCYPLAFGLPAILMLVATVVLMFGSTIYRKLPPSGNVSLEVIKVIGSATAGKVRSLIRRDGERRQSWLDYADTSSYSPAFIREVRIVLGILAVFAPISLFWALYDQQGSRWTYQAIMMNGKLGPISIKPEQMGVFNAVLILVLIPAFDRLLYPILPMTPLVRIFWGMALAVGSFILAAILQFFMEARGTFESDPDNPAVQICTAGCIHVLWQIPQYIVLTCGEVMLSITGLEFAYSQAPASMKSVCSAAWLLTVAAGNLVVILFNEIDPVGWFSFLKNQAAWNFVMWAVILGLGTLGFASMAGQYKYVNIDELHSVTSDKPDSEE